MYLLVLMYSLDLLTIIVCYYGYSIALGLGLALDVAVT